MKLSKIRRLVSLVCAVFMMCVIFAPVAVAANYDDQISPHYTFCHECNIPLERVWMKQAYDPNIVLPGCQGGVHYYAWSDGYVWECRQCGGCEPGTVATGHFCTKNNGHYCLGGCACK